MSVLIATEKSEQVFLAVAVHSHQWDGELHLGRGMER